MNQSYWSGMHNIQEDKEIYNSTKSYPFTFLVNECVDYQVLLDITRYMDGSRDVEVVGQHVCIFNEDGDIVDTLECSLPISFIEEALLNAEDVEL